ncbi:hypothetical protein ACQ4M3_01180 [Leptolyngbya sp. AN03gr2]|uniref:hypothetical protein n=1 Tax=unclassified Leptolyngbya TaxID=2650499 RepID=UPI003D32179F
MTTKTTLLQSIAASVKFADFQLLLDCPSSKIAWNWVEDFELEFAYWALSMGKFEMIIRSPEENISLPASFAIGVSTEFAPEVLPQSNQPGLLWFAHGPVPPALIDTVRDLSENPRCAGVTHLGSERQIIMSDACGVLNPGHTLSEATTWSRPQFWHPQDLIDFRKQCRLSSNLEFTWRSFDPDLGLYDRRSGNWLEFSTRYFLIDGGKGEFYQLCENLGMREIDPPTITNQD